MVDLLDSVSNFSACSARSTDTESSWTPYIVDFITHNNDNSETGSFSSGTCEDLDDDTDRSSMRSDGATKLAGSGHGGKTGFQNEEDRKGVRSKKRKTKKGPLVDDALEDTASSPVNSPKVCRLEKSDAYPGKRVHGLLDINISRKEDKRSELGFNARRDSEITELKKKGLRLVPVSLVVKYQLD